MIASLAEALPAAIPLPSPDPLGYAAPAPILQGLSYLTFSLHLTAVSFTLGGVLLLLWCRWRGGPEHAVAARFWRHALPLGFSYLVTFGVPPLLFVQVLYGQLFYTSSVLIGAFWILIIPLLITAYAGLYLHKLGADTRPRWQTPALALSALTMLSVGFIYVNNLTLSMAPARWALKYTTHPGGGTLHLEEPTLWPRYFLFMAASLTVAGLALLVAGAVLDRWGRAEPGADLRALGLRSFLLGRGLTVAAAVLLLATLPSSLRLRLFAGGPATWLAAIALGLALTATAVALIAVRRKGLGLTIVAVVLLLFEAGSLVALRDQVRLLYLDGVFSLADVPVRAQWGMLAIFGSALVIGLTLVTVVTVKVAAALVAAERAQPREPFKPQAPRRDRAA